MKLNFCYNVNMIYPELNNGSFVLCLKEDCEKNSSFNKGFTIAEVLITLGIIGIIAAMTIPALIGNAGKQQVVARVQKAYSVMAQLVKLSEQDNGPVATWDWSVYGDTPKNTKLFNQYFAPYLKGNIFFGTDYSGCGYSNNVFACRNGITGGCGASLSNSASALFILSDGTAVAIRFDVKTIFIDINGGQQPNMYGKDIFVFTVDPQKGLMPYGFNDTTNITSNCSTASFGSYCAAKIIRDGWQMASDYPW